MNLTSDEAAQLPWKGVISDNVRRLAYVRSGEPLAARPVLVENEDSVALGSLYVQFKSSGKTYHYADVSATEALDVMEAKSVGKALNGLIKKVYDYELVEIGD